MIFLRGRGSTTVAPNLSMVFCLTRLMFMPFSSMASSCAISSSPNSAVSLSLPAEYEALAEQWKGFFWSRIYSWLFGSCIFSTCNAASLLRSLGIGCISPLSQCSSLRRSVGTSEVNAQPPSRRGLLISSVSMNDLSYVSFFSHTTESATSSPVIESLA